MLGEYGMDEALESKPMLKLEGDQCKLLKVDNCQPGRSFELKATAKVAKIEQSVGEDGMPSTEIYLELSGVALDDPGYQVSSVFPTMV